MADGFLANFDDSRGLAHLATSVVLHAVKEMRDAGVQTEEQLRPLQGFGKEKLRLEATVWLASKAAVEWFDACGLDQGYTLARAGWPAHARELLSAGGATLSQGQIRVLALGLDAVGATE